MEESLKALSSTLSSVAAGNGGEEDDYDPCEVAEMADRRWYLVAVAGTTLSLISLICNSLITWVLLRPKHSHFFFLGLLALSDSFLSFCYGPVIAMDIIRARVKALWLTRLWLSYVGPLLALCHVSMTFSCSMIILGTIERYLITHKSEALQWFRKRRGLLALLMFLLAMFLKGTMFFEVHVIKNQNCTGLAEYEPRLTPLTETWLYGTIFRFYVRNIATVFIPFFLLAYLNLRIVDTLRKQKRSASMFRYVGRSDHKVRIRSATRILVLIVCSYLLANVINVMITAWEYVDFQSTQTPETFVIYETLTDIISMLYVLSCATRLPMYITCNREIRSAFVEALCTSRSKSCWCCYGDYSSVKGEGVGGGEEACGHKLSSCRLIVRQAGFGTDFDRIVVSMALAAGVCRSPSAAKKYTRPQLAESEAVFTPEEERRLKAIPLTILNHINNSSSRSNSDCTSTPRCTTEGSGAVPVVIIENPLACLGDENVQANVSL